MKSHRCQPVRSAFTLIELLIVIAVILILAAILFPAFGRARENARRASCQSNMKQIGLGFAQYVQDFDERYPLGVVDAAASGVSPYKPAFGWADALYPYLTNVQIFQCPSESEKQAASSTGAGFSDYFYNTNFNIDSPGLTVGAHVSILSASTTTVLMGEGIATGGSAGNYDAASTPGSASYGLNKPEDAASSNGIAGYERHFSGSNYLFADGHVKWLRADKVSAGLNGVAAPPSSPGSFAATFSLQDTVTVGSGSPSEFTLTLSIIPFAFHPESRTLLATVSGGTGPYTFISFMSWKSGTSSYGPGQETYYSTTETKGLQNFMYDSTNTSDYVFNVTATDANGKTATATYSHDITTP
jgi:prepilin-type N-terminal cleavage/methylation domain-containing protein/prepilin-type processing-associated H-X9-DG protein